MSTQQQPASLGQLLELLDNADYKYGRVTWGEIMDVVGTRSFGSLLLMAGLITLAPLIGDIPGVPTLVGIFVLLVVGQLLVGREHLWLPAFMLSRSVDRQKLHKALNWMKKPARFIDRLLKPRLGFLVLGAMSHVIALLCMFVAMVMPVMEVVPFSANLAGAALTGFGLALIARDGLLALMAMAFTGSVVAVVVSAVV
ncbi:MAG: exopolysaccharide biosynthesis protein [Gammaproteobacteria bacterium]|nr:exopolysaccharide biosynthesis protein [Gammaproteobacteria bacterium]